MPRGRDRGRGRCSRGPWRQCAFASASRVVLDDELHVTGDGDLGALRTANERRAELVELDLEVTRSLGQHVDVTAGRCDLEGLRALGALLDADGLTWLHTERGTVDELAVDDDVAVHDELAGLLDGARESGAEHERVEAHLEQLDEVLTRQAVGASCLVEGDAQLLLANAVLRAEALFLAQAHCVVGVGLALGAAVLARGVRTLLHVAGGLRGEGDAERTGEAGLAT